MRALRTPPDGYVRAGRVMLQGNRRLLVRLNVASLLLFLGAAVVFGFLGTLLRPDLLDFAVLVVGSPVLAVGVLILVPAMQVVLHEAVHGLAFWYFTGSRPVFGFTGWYAYASAPGWYLSRDASLAVLLAPVVLFPVGGLALVMVLPGPVAGLVLLAVIVNTTTSVGDVYLAARLLRVPPAAVVADEPAQLSWYLPNRAAMPGSAPGSGR